MIKFALKARFAIALLLLTLLLPLAMPAGAQGLLLNGQQQFGDANGAPYAGGKVYFYIPNTTTPKNTYQNYNQTVPNTNPVILNSAGRAVIWGSGLYRQVLYDANDVLVWDQQTYAAPAPGTASSGGFGPQGTIAAATTTNIGIIASNNVLVTGAGASIVSFGSTASTSTPLFLLTFQGANTITYNATSMVLPGAKDLSVKAGDAALMLYLGLGNWQMVEWLPAANDPTAQGIGASGNLAAAVTTDLGTIVGNNVYVTGAGVSIASFGTAASTLKPYYLVRFDTANTLVNSSALTIPGNDNITTAGGDSALVLYTGGGNWKILSYSVQGESAKHPQLHVTSFDTSGALTMPTTVTPQTVLELSCVGAGAGGGSNSGGTGGGGGGGGAGGFGSYTITGFNPGQTLTIAVGTGGAGSSNSGSSGASGSAATTFTWNSIVILTCAPGTGGASGTSSPTSLAGGAGGAVSTNFAGSGLTLQGTSVAYTGQTGGTGRYQGNNIASSGAGGGSGLGQGGPAAYSVSGSLAAGLAGNGYGAGGSGGASGSSSQTTGGSGTGGYAMVRGVY